MSGLPDALKIPDGPEQLSLPPNNLPVSSLINFQLPPQHKSTIYADPTDYLADLPPTIITFNVTEIPTPPSIVIKALGRAILCDPEIKSIVLVHSPAHRAKGDRYPLWFATIAVDQANERLKHSATSNTAAECTRAALKALDSLPWDGTVKGFKAGGSIDGLAHWFTTDWLPTDHEEQMLELLAFREGTRASMLRSREISHGSPIWMASAVGGIVCDEGSDPFRHNRKQERKPLGCPRHRL